MWKLTQAEALWFMGGNLHQSRHYSLYLALQLTGRQTGIPTSVYALQEVHYLRWLYLFPGPNVPEPFGVFSRT